MNYGSNIYSSRILVVKIINHVQLKIINNNLSNENHKKKKK